MATEIPHQPEIDFGKRLAEYDTVAVANELQKQIEGRKRAEGPQENPITFPDIWTGLGVARIEHFPNGSKVSSRRLDLFRNSEGLLEEIQEVVYTGWPDSRSLDPADDYLEDDRNVIIGDITNMVTNMQQSYWRGQKPEPLTGGLELNSIPGSGKSTLVKKVEGTGEANYTSPEGANIAASSITNTIAYQVSIVRDLQGRIIKVGNNLVTGKFIYRDVNEDEKGQNRYDKAEKKAEEQLKVNSYLKLKPREVLLAYARTVVQREFILNCLLAEKLQLSTEAVAGSDIDPMSMISTGGMLQAYIFISAHLGYDFVPDGLLATLDSMPYSPDRRLAIVPDFNQWRGQVLQDNDPKRLAILKCSSLPKIYAKLIATGVIEAIDTADKSIEAEVDRIIAEQSLNTIATIKLQLREISEYSWAQEVRNFANMLGLMSLKDETYLLKLGLLLGSSDNSDPKYDANGQLIVDLRLRAIEARMLEQLLPEIGEQERKSVLNDFRSVHKKLQQSGIVNKENQLGVYSQEDFKKAFAPYPSINPAQAYNLYTSICQRFSNNKVEVTEGNIHPSLFRRMIAIFQKGLQGSAPDALTYEQRAFVAVRSADGLQIGRINYHDLQFHIQVELAQKLNETLTLLLTRVNRKDLLQVLKMDEDYRSLLKIALEMGFAFGLRFMQLSMLEHKKQNIDRLNALLMPVQGNLANIFNPKSEDYTIQVLRQSGHVYAGNTARSVLKRLWGLSSLNNGVSASGSYLPNLLTPADDAKGRTFMGLLSELLVGSNKEALNINNIWKRRREILEVYDYALKQIMAPDQFHVTYRKFTLPALIALVESDDASVGRLLGIN
jgi:hypothetical protein